MQKLLLFKENLDKNIKIKYKDESIFMKTLGKILFFNKGFMEDFVTTIGNTVYFPSENFVKTQEKKSIIILAHEYMHICDSNKYSSVLFSFLYLFPQILSLLSLLFFISPWFLLFLLCLLPLPAYFRALFELRGYSVSLFVNSLFMRRENYNDTEIAANLARYADFINKTQFKGIFYYFMWPWGFAKKFIQVNQDIISGDILKKDKAYLVIQNAFNTIYGGQRFA